MAMKRVGLVWVGLWQRKGRGRTGTGKLGMGGWQTGSGLFTLPPS